MFRSMSAFAVFTTAAVLPSLAFAQQLPESWADKLHWRSIGPSNMGGRIIALAVFEQKPTTWWAATASGGLLKTTNNGTTFEHQFDRESVVSIGHVAVAQSDENIVWVGTGEANPRNSVSYGNGVYKSTDGGKSWQHMGLKESFQIGRIAVHPEDPDVVYVGALGRLYGDSEERGLYKTTDGGKNWQRVLFVDDKTGVIDIDMHPTDPDTLLIATYERQRDGFDTNDPAKKYGPGSGIWKTTDGGATFERVTKGLPTCDFGRVGIDWYRKDPKVVMAIVESEKIAKQPEDAPYHGARVESADAGVKIAAVEPRRGRGSAQRRGRGNRTEGESPEKPADTPAKKAGLKAGDVVLAIGGERVNTTGEFERQCRQHKAGDSVTFSVVRDRKDHEIVVKFGKYPKGARSPFTGTLGGQAADMQDMQGENGHEYGGVYKSTDGGDSWTRVNTLNPRPMYYSQIRIDPSNADNVMVLGTSLYRSTDGGKSFDRGAGRGMHVDHHAEWIDPNNGDHIIHGCDGGIYVTHDACKNWDHLNHVAIGQFYHVGVSSDRNYRVYGGLQDNGSWGGPSRTAGTGARNHDWVRIGGGDGFRCLVDPDDKNVVYSQSQNGPPGWRNLANSERGSLRPRRGRGGNRERIRFNWETPYILSGHNSKIVYTAGSKVLKSLNRGRNMQVISPNITNTDRGSATALAESPRDANIVYVGTDDGALWVTHDGGDNWTDCFEEPAADPTESGEAEGAGVNERERGPAAADPFVRDAQPIAQLVPGPRWVSELVASRHEAKRAYVTLDGHRSDDDAAYVLATEDAGLTWKSLTATLPKNAGSTRTITEDPVNGDVLYLGTEFQTFVSLDRGENWTRFNGDLPTVSVHAFAVNVPSGEIVAGTHGRSLWITNVNEIRQMTKEVLAKDAHFYRPVSAIVWRSGMSTGSTNRRFAGENPGSGARLVYHLKKAAKSAAIEVLDSSGKAVRTMKAPTEKGLHTVTWNLRGPARIPDGASERARQWYMSRGGARVDPGTYTLNLVVDGETMTQKLKLELDPDHPDPSWLSNEQANELFEAEYGVEGEEEGDADSDR
ncbi:MAG: PDZ domain-containing protein [bacterium]|nr:PDZ domain-containing protein [bacterium]